MHLGERVKGVFFFTKYLQHVYIKFMKVTELLCVVKGVLLCTC